MSEAPNHEDVRQALDRFADLILFDQSFMQRFTHAPREVRDEYDLGAIPEEVLDAVADISMDELRVLAQIHKRRQPIVVEGNVCIIF
jgi:hypothetical protein